LDPDRGRRRPQLGSAEQAVATWFEAAAWAGARGGGGRVLVQTRDPGDPAIQALVRWDPSFFHRAERRRREEAGFPPGFPVFRVRGSRELPGALEALGPVTLLRSSAGGQTVCLVVLRPDALAAFGARIRELASDGVVERVEAEPHL
ncbi:MAG TPA: hypothetical protein VG709_03925, partial [Actinomycetota bacterium]|nr:hypothetical protein [Actinomycetota bacterium]